MNPINSLVRETLRGFKPCVHGAEVIGAAEESGLAPDEVLDFSSSVNPLGPSQKALDSITESLAQIAAYPDSNSNQLREVIAANFDGLDKGNVVVGNGSTELMYLFAETFLNKGEVALMPAPTFGEYESAVRKAGGIPKFSRLNGDFQISLDSFIREMKGVKIVFLCNPNNPTGKTLPKPTLTTIVESALNQGTLVFLDEDFLEFVQDEQAHSLISKIKQYPNLLILKSFTKIYGLTGLRVGYGIASKEIINVLLCAKLPWNVNCLAQSAAVAALKDIEHLKVTLELIKKEKAWLFSELGKVEGFRFELPDANFFFIDIEKSGLTAAELKRRLLAEGILIRDCSSFQGLDGFHVRIAVKTHGENEQLIEALKRTVKDR